MIYLLHAFSLLRGVLGAATVIGAFLVGWPSIVAVMLNYVKRERRARHVARVAFPLADPDVLVRAAVGHALRALRRPDPRPRHSGSPGCRLALSRSGSSTGSCAGGWR